MKIKTNELIEKLLPNADIYVCILSYVITRDSEGKSDPVIYDNISYTNIQFKEVAILEATSNGMEKDSKFLMSDEGNIFIELIKNCINNLIKYNILDRNNFFIYIDRKDGEMESLIGLTYKTYNFYKSFFNKVKKLEKVKSLWWLKKEEDNKNENEM